MATNTTTAQNAETSTWSAFTDAIQAQLNRAESLLDHNPAEALAISMAAMKSISESLQRAGQTAD